MYKENRQEARAASPPRFAILGLLQTVRQSSRLDHRRVAGKKDTPAMEALFLATPIAGNYPVKVPRPRLAPRPPHAGLRMGTRWALGRPAQKHAAPAHPCGRGS